MWLSPEAPRRSSPSGVHPLEEQEKQQPDGPWPMPCICCSERLASLLYTRIEGHGPEASGQGPGETVVSGGVLQCTWQRWRCCSGKRWELVEHLSLLDFLFLLCPSRPAIQPLKGHVKVRRQRRQLKKIWISSVGRFHPHPFLKIVLFKIWGI